MLFGCSGEMWGFEDYSGGKFKILGSQLVVNCFGTPIPDSELKNNTLLFVAPTLKGGKKGMLTRQRLGL